MRTTCGKLTHLACELEKAESREISRYLISKLWTTNADAMIRVFTISIGYLPFGHTNLFYVIYSISCNYEYR